MVNEQLFEAEENQKTWLTAFLMKLRMQGFTAKELLTTQGDYTTNYKGEISSIIRFNFFTKSDFNQMFGIAHNITQGRGVIPLATQTRVNEWSIVLVLCYKMRALIKQEISVRINEIKSLISGNPQILNGSNFSVDFDSKPSDYDSARIKFKISSNNQFSFLKNSLKEKDYNFILKEDKVIEVRNLAKGLYEILNEKFKELIANSGKYLFSEIELTPSVLKDFLNHNGIGVSSTPPLCYEPRWDAIRLCISDHSQSKFVGDLFTQNNIKFKNPKHPHVFMIEGSPDVKNILVKKVLKKNDVVNIRTIMTRTEAKEKLENFFNTKKINFKKFSNISAGDNAHYYTFKDGVEQAKNLIDSELLDFNVRPIVRTKQKGLIIEFLLNKSGANSIVPSIPVEIKTEPKALKKEISEFSVDELVAEIIKKADLASSFSKIISQINEVSDAYVCVPIQNVVLKLEEGSLKIKDPFIQIEGAKKLNELIKK